MEESLFKFIEDTIFKITGQKGLVYDTDFVKDLGLTSFDVMNIVCVFEDHFDVMNIVCVFEDHFDVEIPSRDVWKLRRVKDVIDYMILKGLTDV